MAARVTSLDGRSAAGLLFVLCAGLLAGGAPGIDAARDGIARVTGEPAVCAFRARTGHDCVGCGGTRAFGHVARGRLVAGFRANPVGAMIALVTASLALAALWALITGRSRPLAWTALAGVGLVTSTFAVHAVLWWRALPPGIALR
jgi:hypothetical protein